MPILFSRSAALLILSAIFPGVAFTAANSSLAIVDAGVEQAEDAPFVPPDYQFLPGDSVFFTFQIAGFGVQSQDSDEVRRISLTFEITAQDARGVALAAPNSGVIRVDLNPEDKNWMPKRETAFMLPTVVSAGEYRIHVVVKDLFAKTEVTKDFPFRIGGITITAASAITVEHFRFLREEDDREPLQVAAYRPGDTVYIRFEMVGQKVGPENRYRLTYALTVLRPNGKPFLEEPKAADLDATSFYPAPFIPGNFSVTTSPDTPRGEYVVVLNVRDLLGNQTCQAKQAFSIE